MRKTILTVYAWIFGIGGAYTLLILTTGISFPCFFHLFTGLNCPACGVSRMFLAIFRLDFAAAFRYNPVIFLLLFPWNGAAILGILGKPALFQKPGTWDVMVWVSTACLILFGILRNIC